MDKTQVLISLVIPCFNEENNVIPFYEKTVRAFGGDLSGIELIFVNDGSRDGTENSLRSLFDAHRETVKVVTFTRNFGKESAMLAGLEKARGEFAVIIDADLQQNPKYVLEMKRYLDEHPDYDVVCCVQEKRKESLFMKTMKKSFNRILNRMAEVQIQDAASDFRMMRRRVVDAILNLKESNRFSKGIFAWVGFNTYYMPYVVEERASGASKWGAKKLFGYAFRGIVSFSDKPLLFALKCGTFFLCLSVLLFIGLIVGVILNRIDFSNNLFILDAIVFFASLILISNGVLGKYLAAVYTESKDRPKYVIKEFLNNDIRA